MTTLKSGQTVGIPCHFGTGAFPDEYLVTFESTKGPVSGFVKEEDFEKTGENQGRIRALVLDLTPQALTVKVYGSFFTTTGLAYLPPEWAGSKVRPFAHA